jgi:starch phosphorylase
VRAFFLERDLPAGLEALTDLALDLRWTWSHAGDAVWRAISPALWEQIRNPWVVLEMVPEDELERLAGDPRFREQLKDLLAARDRYLSEPGWFGRNHSGKELKRVAYFSMEFGLGEALPLYAGGLGVLAGDYLKAASDLGVPLVGVGLLYQEGYFRQVLDARGEQQDLYPYNDPTSLPIRPVQSPSGGWLHVPLELPGRTLLLRVWMATVGRVPLYLLDTNDPLNSPADRGITSKLYGGGPELRLMQEIVLGIGGLRALESLGLEVDVCHLNEGHAALVVLERALRFMQKHGVGFREAWWATRGGNVFTTHTPVAAGFDRYDPDLINKYFPYFRDYVAKLGISLPELAALGRKDPGDRAEPVNLAYLAIRGSWLTNGVSRLHGAVSRRLFAPLYPRWPEREVPVTQVTNGVHAPTWDSPWADEIWTRACGKRRWLDLTETLPESMSCVTDEDLWALRAKQRQDLVERARARLARILGQRGEEPESVALARTVLDPEFLTLGFARRFTEYKRPNMLLQDPGRLTRLLTNRERPVQIIVAGKAHPQDAEGKRLVQAWIDFFRQPAVRRRGVFLEDYDLALARTLVRGVDVWINTPRRPWEACGTSGMKVLVNGGLNLSELDGWWAEAYSPEVGWALGDGREHLEPEWDAEEAGQLYRLLEEEIVPRFYERDASGIPRSWVARVRTSMARLAPRFSSNRMLREYVERLYLPAARCFGRRRAGGAALAKELATWERKLAQHWGQVRFGDVEVTSDGTDWLFRVQVYLGELSPDWVRLELYADPLAGAQDHFVRPLERMGRIETAVNGFLYQGAVPGSRPSSHYTARVVPNHPQARVPAEAGWILWQR